VVNVGYDSYVSNILHNAILKIGAKVRLIVGDNAITF